MNWFYKATQTSSNESFFPCLPPVLQHAVPPSTTWVNTVRFYYVNRSVAYSRQTEQLSMLANALNIRADIHINTKNNGAAGKRPRRAPGSTQKIGDLFLPCSTWPSYRISTPQPARPEGYPERSGRDCPLHTKTEPGSQTSFSVQGPCGKETINGWATTRTMGPPWKPS